MLVTTRFGNTPQIHHVKVPGGARTQLTFFNEPIGGASFEPQQGRYVVFNKDVGGNEFGQLYRYDVADGRITLLTDGKSRNSGPTWSNKGDRIAYVGPRLDGSGRTEIDTSPVASAPPATLPPGGRRGRRERFYLVLLPTESSLRLLDFS